MPAAGVAATDVRSRLPLFQQINAPEVGPTPAVENAVVGDVEAVGAESIVLCERADAVIRRVDGVREIVGQANDQAILPNGPVVQTRTDSPGRKTGVPRFSNTGWATTELARRIATVARIVFRSISVHPSRWAPN